MPDKLINSIIVYREFKWRSHLNVEYKNKNLIESKDERTFYLTQNYKDAPQFELARIENKKNILVEYQNTPFSFIMAVNITHRKLVVLI